MKHPGYTPAIPYGRLTSFQSVAGTECCPSAIIVVVDLWVILDLISCSLGSFRFRLFDWAGI